MALSLGAHATRREDPPVFNTQVRKLTQPVTPASGTPTPSSQHCWSFTCAHLCTHRETYTYKYN